MDVEEGVDGARALRLYMKWFNFGGRKKKQKGCVKISFI